MGCYCIQKLLGMFSRSVTKKFKSFAVDEGDQGSQVKKKKIVPTGDIGYVNLTVASLFYIQ
jgi:hypothetical protein